MSSQSGGNPEAIRRQSGGPRLVSTCRQLGGNREVIGRQSGGHRQVMRRQSSEAMRRQSGEAALDRQAIGSGSSSLIKRAIASHQVPSRGQSRPIMSHQGDNHAQSSPIKGTIALHQVASSRVRHQLVAQEAEEADAAVGGRPLCLFLSPALGRLLDDLQKGSGGVRRDSEGVRRGQKG